jgi:iron(III) transport system substrate-binding protein
MKAIRQLAGNLGFQGLSFGLERQSALLFFAATALLFLLRTPYCLTAGEAIPGWQAEWEKTTQAAKKEGQLSIYGSDDFEALFKEFHKKYPEISVTGYFANGSRAAERLMAERRGGKYLADLYLNGMTTGYNVLYKAKVLDPIKPVLMMPEVVDESKWWKGKHRYLDAEGQYLFIFNGQSRVEIGYNTKLVDPKEMKSYWDLLGPKWRGKIVVMDPTLGGAVGTALRFFYSHPALGPKFLERLLTEMDVTPSRDSRQIADWLAAGRFAISMFVAPSRADLPKAKEQGLPVDWFDTRHFKEGAGLTSGSGGAGLINRAPHPNAAKVALNWLFSREGQILYQRTFQSGGEGPDSLRTDIPKDDVPRDNRRIEGGNYLITDNAEWMDFTPIRTFINDIWAKGKK